MNYQTGSVLMVLGLSVGAVACAEVPQCQVPARVEVVELFTWWVGAGEAAAAKALIKVHEEKLAGQNRPTRVVHTTMGTAKLARDYLWNSRLNERRMPDTFQANIGKELLRTRRDYIKPVKTALIGTDLQTAFKSVFADLGVSDDAERPCIPLNIHRLNTLFFNRAVLEKYGLARRNIETLSGFRETCQALTDEGQMKEPIALGTFDAAWTLSLLVHEALLPALAGAQEYRDFWEGREANPNENPFLREAYNEVVNWVSKKWFNSNYSQITWKEASNRLFSERNPAAFYIMGDWAWAELRNNYGDRADRDIERMPFPSDSPSNKPFVYTADCLTLSRNEHSWNHAVELLKTAASPSGQIEFSKLKGSIPARDDIPMEDMKGLPAPALQTANDFSEARGQDQLLLAVSGYTKDDLIGLTDELLGMLTTRDPANILDFWAKNYYKLSQ